MASVLILALVTSSCGRRVDLDSDAAAAPVARGLVHGHVRVTGAVPPNEMIHMNADPMCVRAVEGAHVTDDAIVASADGSLANVFVELVGTFPDTPVPAGAVFVDQRGCTYSPRVVAVRAGQTLQVRNSDDGLHNVHGVSTEKDGFNVSQPTRGMVNAFHPHDAGILQLKCDVHTWMVAFVGVVNHPYFAVTSADGSFALRDVPEGTYELRAWHERLGTMVSKVHVDAAHESNVEMTYSATPASVP
ncbi:MAG TPA: hypothetical protein VFP91_23300 [Vicinamibacterales bacterium]|nr:hypothetical protein [Vicinamibacterales bacterium]